MLDKLISERSQTKLTLFRYLENRLGATTKFVELEKELGYTNYLIKSLVGELNEDALSLPMDNSFHITIDKDQIEFQQQYYVSSNILEEEYLSQSQEFLLLKSIFFNKFGSKKSYSEKNYLSRTSVHRLFDRVNHQLKEYNLSLDGKGHIQGDEMLIRQFFSALFYKVYKDSFSLYSLAAQADFVHLETDLKKSIRHYSSSSRFKHYVLVSLVRIQAEKKNVLSKTYYPLEIRNEQLIEVCEDWLIKSGLNDEDVENETASLIGNIRDIDFKAHGIVRDFTLCREYSDALYQELQSSISSTVNRELLENEKLQDTIFDYLYIDICKDVFLREIDLTYFKENFPEYFYSCFSFIKKNVKEKQEASHNKVSFFFDLLLSIINIMPYSTVGSEINIFVNFVHGDAYNEFIKKNIATFSNFNFKFHSHLRPDTDLILSDHIVNQELLDQTIIWLSPPRAKDWEVFGDHVVTISHNKYDAQKKQTD
ncbi:helix-turn-helix domain-containing protein [Enterococcus sp. AZ196]|uniref:helix-turn-helix domain-containing protein n=1 Tax=Enterococcus sp. AZ196 TaxID=2774659 RepID=UPI003D2B476D